MHSYQQSNEDAVPAVPGTRPPAADVVVTLTDTQTLTNKTLTDPVVNQAAIARTATTTGATTGTIAAHGALQHVVVTSDDTNKIIVLPAPTPGVTVVLFGTAGYELRSNAPATVAINGGTGVNAESAIAADSMVVATCVSATAWRAFFVNAVGEVAAVEAAAP